ncbi:MAG: 1-acyl-sn-glycerol-3-phosphate acyltransferase [Oscillospiraceae bacterium]|nr:1-acyl-sn-glycerol-3-phosphate acyltransferase [Oscillospiraceae bacterium]
MDDHERLQRNWRALYRLCHRYICRKFNMTHEDLSVDGPVLLIPNHSCGWDPLLVAMSLPEKQVYFVASEHIFRLGFVSRLLERFLAPIPRKKASSGADTVKACLRHLKAGHSVCLFAEGEQTWDGVSRPVFPATGKLVKSSGATLVTYRIEGAYLSLPRWGKGVRRGRVHGAPVGIYPPETLRSMTPQAINALIERDLYENAWTRQRENPVAFKGRRRAEGLERMLYLCPSCRRIGTLQSRGDRVFCSCGLDLHYTEEGFFNPCEPFSTLADWDAWQRKTLKTIDFSPSEPCFSDEGAVLSRIGAGHREELLARGKLLRYADRLECGAFSFPADEIVSMAMVQDHLLLFSFRDEYYQIRAGKNANLKKYLDLQTAG